MNTQAVPMRPTDAPKPAERTGPTTSRENPFAGIVRSLKGETVSSKHLLIMTSQLAVMLASGCDLVAGLEAMARQQQQKYLKTVIESLRDDVKGGRAFSQALARFPHVFSPLYITMMRAGESSGLMKHMLQTLQLMIRNNIRITGSIRGALMYPAILTMVAITAIIVMTTFVLPRFGNVFKQSNVPLPTPTVIVMGVSEYVSTHYTLVLGGLFAFIALVIWVLRAPSLKPRVDSLKLRIPLVGQALKLSYVCRSVQTMGMLLKSGLPLAEALLLTRDMMPNVQYWAFFNMVHKHITEGKPMSVDFESSSLFPPMVPQMLSVGEATGTLPNVCMEIANFHEEELTEKIKVLTTAIEPLIIVLLGGFVGFIAVSVILPMFKISSAVH